MSQNEFLGEMVEHHNLECGWLYLVGDKFSQVVEQFDFEFIVLK